MHRVHLPLATTLALLYFVMSFNAYACLLPLSPMETAEMGNGCSTPEEQPARQVCDAFKTFNVEASGQGQPTFDSQMLWFGETASGVLLSSPPLAGILKYPFPSDSSSQLLRTSTTVLRI